ncbi:AraC family transcriptional regulator [Maribellus maritimus]|uniref:AraC family transcriptional regulator n=1 Tax=Maribellus maritimus TaxID=2870838 RepID=UPI001EEC36C2|nr:AraC family transcriptional regulator [Maribellus maritimus]MCG6191293.1 AraC family transcriptional regulator [Maribellus maritimus]
MEKRHYILNQFKDDARDVYHPNRVTIHSNQNSSHQDHYYHDHDYAEIFWIERGRGTHLINNTKIPLCKGSIVMMRPSDAHTFFSGDSIEGITITNIAFPVSTLQSFKERYFNSTFTYFWIDTELPFMVNLPYNLLVKISLMGDRLFKCERGTLQLDLFLLYVFNLLDEKNKILRNISIPKWLDYALKAYTTPELFREGSAGFVKLTNCTPDHVNRTLKKHFGQTLSFTTNKAKMEYAAIQLTITDASIKFICKDCGFDSLSHFYKLFSEYYKVSPSKYRKLNNTVI